MMSSFEKKGMTGYLYKALVEPELGVGMAGRGLHYKYGMQESA